MIGPPGTGKTMLAQRLPTITPQPTLSESLETTKIYSVAGYLESTQSLIATRPFRAPHHTISEAGMIGGGTHPKPGEISLSHYGVLFLDELPEFDRTALEALRQPLETGTVTISRASGTITYPAQIMLVCATNPCPCGYFTDTRKSCHCTPYQIQKYMSKVSGPLLDRIDIHIEVPALHHSELVATSKGQSSAEVREVVSKARNIQHERFKGSKNLTNSRMSSKQIKKHCALDSHAETLLHQAMIELGLSARGYNKILKVARTIADLEGGENIKVEHISEAIQYRSLDRGLWR
jgi:magnesium chelatase family protein